MKTWTLRLALTLFCAAWLGACASTVPPVAAPKADVLRSWGQPTASHALPQGGERLEYASGPFGRTTWMIDLDRTGAVTQARQVLNEAEFLRLQSASNLSANDVLRWIGTPGERRGARGGGQTWSWRYPTNDCLWFQASVSASGQLQSAAYGIDPTCDMRGDAKSTN
ncbi:MAG: hypothetical protein LH480_11590 [Rubrivivax sp.]|nr:hypothetical protein [Rubrivivax sp.]